MTNNGNEIEAISTTNKGRFRKPFLKVTKKKVHNLIWSRKSFQYL